MNGVATILQQFDSAWSGEAWHGPALQELLNGVTAAAASARPIPQAHTIWELVLHIRAWEVAVRRRLGGEDVELDGEEDFPIAGAGDSAWQQALAALASGHQQLRGVIASLSETSLDAIVPGKTHSVSFMLHGVIQHNLYHAGQIALLKKALGSVTS